MRFDPSLTTSLVTALTPTLAVFLGILFQRQEIRDLRTELRGDMDRLRTELRGDMDKLRAEIRSDMDKLRAEMLAFRNQVHGDLLLIHERVAKVEARQGQ